MNSESQTLPQNDHDLLVTIHGQVTRVIVDVKELKDNVADRVNKLEDGKMSKVDALQMKADADKVHTDHENRLRLVEQKADELRTTIKTWGALATALLALLQIALRFIT